MSATYPMDMVRGRLTVQVIFLSFFWNLNLFDLCWINSLLPLGAGLPLVITLMTNIHIYIIYLQTEKSPRQYRGIFHALSTVLREEGFRALYKGWLPSVIGVVSKTVLWMPA